MKVETFFRWYDLWIGVYVDTERHTAYICLLPMLGIKIRWHVGPVCSRCGYEGDYGDTIKECKGYDH